MPYVLLYFISNRNVVLQFYYLVVEVVVLAMEVATEPVVTFPGGWATWIRLLTTEGISGNTPAAAAAHCLRSSEGLPETEAAAETPGV